jgi:hypothetical protein
MAKKKEQNKIASSGENATKELEKMQLTDEEKARLENYRQRLRKKPVSFKNERSKKGAFSISPATPNDPLYEVKMLEALGTPDTELQRYFLSQVVQTFSGVTSKEKTNFDAAIASMNSALSILNGIQPKDEIEGMLAIQMIGIHNLAVDALNRAMLSGQSFEGRKTNVSYVTQMSRAFVMQMEALKKYRTSSQIKMVVRSVSVSDGGQAIVGTVNQSAEKKT